MKTYKKITILIPCHNEEKGIGTVIDTIPLRFLKRMGYITEVIVINNNSTDRTAHVAMKRKVRVIVEEKKGKGHAIITGFNAVSPDTKFIVMLDGDNTYKSTEIPRLIEPLMSNFCDVVIGSRLGGKMKKNSLKIQNRIVNWGYTFLVRQFYRTNITDVLSGYFAWKKEVLDILIPHLISEGFEIEMEMLTKMEKLGFEVYSVPITYDQREGHTKIEALKDGLRILKVFFRNLLWTPTPKRYQGFFGTVLQKAMNLL
ncbi:MAG TPA: glycosyltransferase family 2 protein [Patescibacteria group bacterium]